MVKKRQLVLKYLIFINIDIVAYTLTHIRRLRKEGQKIIIKMSTISGSLLGGFWLLTLILPKSNDGGYFQLHRPETRTEEITPRPYTQ